MQTAPIPDREEIDMYKFTNKMTGEEFAAFRERNRHMLKEIPVPCTSQRKWRISDKMGNMWDITFKGDVDEWRISCVGNKPSYTPFTVNVISHGDRVEIHESWKNGRHLTDSRFLRSLSHLAIMLNCYIQFGYLN